MRFPAFMESFHERRELPKRYLIPASRKVAASIPI